MIHTSENKKPLLARDKFHFYNLLSLIIHILLLMEILEISPVEKTKVADAGIVRHKTHILLIHKNPPLRQEKFCKSIPLKELYHCIP